MKTLLAFFILFYLSFSAMSQNNTDAGYFDKEVFKHKIVISQDYELKNYLETYIKYNKKRNGFNGYRIKIYSQNTSSARNKANAMKIAFEQSNKEQKAYVVYHSPNFEVRVGDFTNRFEAMHFLNGISSTYPDAFIIEDIVQFPNRETKNK